MIEGMKFNPDHLEISVGDTVKWVNKDIVPHTATAVNGAFDSKTIDPSKSWQHVFKSAGEFDYKCILHPTMKASLKVIRSRSASHF